MFIVYGICYKISHLSRPNWYRLCETGVGRVVSTRTFFFLFKSITTIIRISILLLLLLLLLLSLLLLLVLLLLLLLLLYIRLIVHHSVIWIVNYFGTETSITMARENPSLLSILLLLRYLFVYAFVSSFICRFLLQYQYPFHGLLNC